MMIGVRNKGKNASKANARIQFITERKKNKP